MRRAQFMLKIIWKCWIIACENRDIQYKSYSMRTAQFMLEIRPELSLAKQYQTPSGWNVLVFLWWEKFVLVPQCETSPLNVLVWLLSCLSIMFLIICIFSFYNRNYFIFGQFCFFFSRLYIFSNPFLLHSWNQFWFRSLLSISFFVYDPFLAEQRFNFLREYCVKIRIYAIWKNRDASLLLPTTG